MNNQFKILIGLLLVFLLVGSVNAAVTATTTYTGNYVVVSFTGSGTTTWTVPTGTTSVEYLVVAGGGGGGYTPGYGGGGGAGGYTTAGGYAVTAGSTVYIGVGAGGVNSAGYNGTNGGVSYLYNGATNVTRTGGGGGGTYSGNWRPGNGGSGGGGHGYTYPEPGTGIDGEGSNGGYGNQFSPYTGGGGGGYGGVGGNPTAGLGVSNTITGASVTYAAGGSGSTNTGGTNGNVPNANTGSGGGSGYNGANGIVIIKYADVSSFTTNKSSGSIGLVVQFTDYSNNAPTTWDWNWGDGSAHGTTQNPTHTYTTIGSFNVTLNASNANGGNPVTFWRCVETGQVPQSSINTKVLYLPFNGSNGDKTTTDRSTYNHTTLMQGAAGSISNLQSKFGGTSFYINNGEGVIIVPDNESLNFSTHDFYVGWWENSTARGDSMMTLNHYRVPLTGPVGYGYFMPYVASGNSYFYGTSDGVTPWNFINGAFMGVYTCKTWNYYVITRNGTSLQTWKNGVIQSNNNVGTTTLSDIGDSLHIGGYSAGATSPSFSGNYEFLDDLVVFNGLHINGSIVPTMELINNPNANFTPNITSGLLPLTVNFTDNSTGDGMTRNWSFGDGFYSNGVSPTHTFSNPANFSVTLTVTGIGTSAMTKYINVTANNITPNFITNVSFGSRNLPVLFTNRSTNLTGGQAWFFGDENWSTFIWTNITGVPTPWSSRFSGSLLAMPDGSLILTGGGAVGGATSYYNDTWRSIDNGSTWTLVNASCGYPARRDIQGVSLSDGSIVVMGGNSASVYNDTWRSTDNGATWIQQNASSGWQPRTYFTSVVLPDDSIIVIGGSIGATYYNDTWRSVNKGVTWTLMNASGGWSARTQLMSTSLLDGTIIVSGGNDGAIKNDTWKSTNNGATWTLVNASGYPVRAYGQLKPLFDGSLFLIGGYSGATGLNDTWRSTDQGSTWTLLNSSAGMTRVWAAMSTSTHDGRIIYLGGYNGSASMNLTWTLDPIGSRSQNPSHTYTTSGHYNVSLSVFNFTTEQFSSFIRPGAIGVFNQTIAEFTANITSGSSPLAVLFTNSSLNTTGRSWFFGDENYTNVSWTQVNASSGWYGRYGFSTASLPDGSIVIMGGTNASAFNNETWRSTNNGTTWTKVNSSSGWAIRYGSSAVTLPDGSIILAGGTNSVSIVYNDTWKSSDNGVTWTMLNASSGWAARWVFSMVLMNDNSIIIMGGSPDAPGTGTPLNDTWRSTDGGITWVQQNASSGWSKRNRFAGFATPDGNLIITGGYDFVNTLNDTWRSSNSGVTWTQVNASSGYPARRFFTGVTELDGSILIMGGVNTTTFNDTWRSTDDGSTWSSINSSNGGWISRRGFSSTVLSNGSILLMGGLDQAGSGFLNDTWIFNPAASTANDPTHTYTASGNYSVSLYAYSSENSNLSFRTGYINVTDQSISNFSANVTNGYSPLNVMFNDTSSGIPLTWIWNATNVTGNNTPFTFSTDKNVTYVFGVGNFSISLTVTDLIGTNTSTLKLFVNVSDPVTYTNGSYTVVVFNSTGNTTWTVPANVTEIEYLIVAGGGQGAGYVGGGGGAGGFLNGNINVSPTTSYDIIVGAGGDGQVVGYAGYHGDNSTFSNASLIISSKGGGGGARYNFADDTNRSGGSGGGGAGYLAAAKPGGSNVSGQGFPGGTSPDVAASGGGGANEIGYPGADGGSYNGGNGGDGRNSSITGSEITYAGGGGGGWYAGGTPGSGGDGGGGTANVAGTDKLGGGGGGFGAVSGAGIGGKGGTGIIIIRYLNFPLSSFNANNTTGSDPMVVNFTDTSTNSPTQWMWNATNVTGNNTAFTFSTIQNPVYTFGVGNFSIKLNVTSGGGTNTSTQVTFINVSQSIPIANFTSNVTTSTVYPLVVRFNDTSSDSPTTWNWSFGDGRWFNTTNSALRNTSYQYAVAGKYAVNLTVNNSVGATNISKVDYINLTADDDPNVTSWLHMNGTNGATTFTDQKGLAWLANGNAQITTATFKYGGASGSFDGNGDYISTPNSSAFSFGTGDFTIEFWMNSTSVIGVNDHIFSKTNNARTQGWGFDCTGGNDAGWDFYMGNDTNGQVFVGTSIPNKTWNHIVIERISGTIYIYVNGTLTNSSAGFNANYDTANPMWIMRQFNNYANGFVDEFRISKGVARWTSNFTVPYNEYKGILETVYPDINPNSTFRYKTNPTDNAYVDNLTPRNRTLQIQNITNTSYVVGSIIFPSEFGYVTETRLNLSYFPTGMVLVCSTVDNTNGLIEFNISRSIGFNVTPGDRASIFDYRIAYVNYTDGTVPVTQFFGYGYLINGTTGKTYGVHNFLGTPVTYGDWNFTANFTATNTTIWLGNITTFNATFNGSYPNRWNWTIEGIEGDPDDYVDGANSTVNYLYDRTGYFNVSLKEYLWQNGSVNNTSTKFNYILVYNQTTANITSNVTAGLKPLAVQFSANFTENANMYNWSFDDGTFDNSNATMPIHTYNTAGVYNVSLNTSFFGMGNSSQTNYTIVVYDPVLTGFSANNTAGMEPLAITFNVTYPNDAAMIWNWSFGDGTWQNGTTQNSTHTYTVGGLYTVSEYASNPFSSNVTTILNYIDVYNSTIAGFTSNATFGTLPLAVMFNVTTTNDNATAWNWSFGDGTYQNTSEQNATHLYTVAGIYSVSENATNPFSIHNDTHTISIYSPVKANFTTNETTGYPPTDIQFTDTSLNATGWSWFFGDEPYNQSWSMIAGITNWTVTSEHSSVVLQDGSIILMGGFDGNVALGNVWRSTDGGLGWLEVNSSAWTPRESLSAVALPDGSIVVMGGNNGFTRFNDVWRSVDKGSTWTNMNNSAPWGLRSNATAVVTSDGSIILIGGYDGVVDNDAWKSSDKGETWTLLNGSTGISSESSVGVVLTDNSIMVMGGTDGVTTFNSTWRSVDQGITWVLVNSSSPWEARTNFGGVAMPDGSVVILGGNRNGVLDAGDVWRSTDFGSNWTQLAESFYPRDGFTVVTLPDGKIVFMGGFDGSGDYFHDVWGLQSVGSSIQNPVHTYTLLANYTSVLQAFATYGVNISSQHAINITTDKPITDFTSNNTTGVFPLAVQFNDTSSNNPETWNWSFGDGIYSNDQNASHIYYTGGAFTVILNASNNAGYNATTKINYITVYNETIAHITSNVTSGVVPFAVQFYGNTSVNATWWNWSFTNGTQQNFTNDNETEIFLLGNDVGFPYTTLLTTSNNGYGDNSTFYTIFAYNQTLSGFSANNTTGNVPAGVVFNVTYPLDSATIWNWSFGDGSWQNGSHLPERVVNGGFEVGDLTGWGSFVGLGNISVFSGDSHNGNFAVNLSNDVTYINQSVDLTNINTLSWWDKYTDSPGVLLVTIDTTPIYTSVLNSGYTSRSVDVSYIGNHIINFTYPNSSGALLDDVSVDGLNYQNATHIYTSSGNYTVSEFVKNNLTSNSTTRVNYINITYFNQTITGFTANTTFGITPLNVGFTVTTTHDNATMWNWSFGDGTWQNGTIQNATHVYTSMGNFTVNETASNPLFTNFTSVFEYISTFNQTISGFNANNTTGINPFAVIFNVTSPSDNATRWNWSFGDGSWQNTTDQNASHIYLTNGLFTVTEIASNIGSTNITTRLNYITVFNQTITGFTANTTTGIAPQGVIFNVTIPNDNATTWNWSFGDGSWQNSTTLQNSTHTYILGGNYTVNETASNTGSTNTTTRFNYINITNPTISGFVANVTAGVFPLNVQFNVTTPSDNATMWNWSFGDGGVQNSSDQNATHIYYTGGTYTVNETAQNNLASNTTVRDNYIIVYNITTNSFIENTTFGFVPLPVSFVVVSENATWWNWSWGDGTFTNMTNGSVNVDHIFTVIGNHTVTLNTSNEGYGSFVSSAYINSTFYQPLASFISTPSSGTLPLNVIFNDTSANSPTQWNWSFGDGTFQNSSVINNATHLYSSSGTYIVNLTVSSGFGESTASQNIVVFSTGPVASFSENITIGSAPLSVQFTDTSSITNISSVSWFWKFGDGATSTLQNPIHIYGSNGAYVVNLTVSDEVGTDQSTDAIIYVSSSGIPIVTFLAVPTSGPAPLNVTFTDLTIGGQTSWNWSFGDGAFSNLQNPTHNYTLVGQYIVRLTVANGTQFSNTSDAVYINVGIASNTVIANYTANPTSGNYPLIVQFTDSSICNPACNSWNWDLDGDGATDSNVQNPVFTYNYPLNYTPKLIVSNGLNSGTKIRVQYIVVGPAFIYPTITQPTTPWVPGYQNQSTGLIVSFKGDSSLDLPNSSYLRYWLQNFTATGDFNVYGFVTSIMAPLMHVFGFWIFLIIWGLYIFAVWIRSQDVTLPLIIGILSMGTFGLLFPKEAMPVVIIMFVICGAIIVTKLMKDSL